MIEDIEEETAVSAEPDSGSFDLSGMEDDPEAWLEQLLSGEMDVEMEPPPIKPSEDAMFITDDARLAESAPAAEEEAAPEVEPVVEAEVDTPELAEPDIIAGVPDDPDEAMAWLEQLAARQGAAIEELPSVTDPAAEPEMPDWMAQDLDGLTLDTEADLLEVVEEDEITAVSELDSPETAVEPDVDIEDELPDWIGSSSRPTGDTDWLNDLPEIDMDTWLSAEEEATLSGPVETDELPDTGPLRSPAQPRQTDELEEDDLFEPVVEPSSGAYSVDEDMLATAQTALADGRLPDALTHFKNLVSTGTGMMAIIAELEQAADSHPKAPALFQVLGDAYMRNGQLQKALVSYRTALDNM